MYKYDCYFRTDAGVLRANNEDNFFLNGYIKRDPELPACRKKDLVYGSGLFAVCDGLGGEENGERAALIAVENLKNYSNTDFLQVSEQYIQDTNSKICKMCSDYNCVRTGSTLAVLYINENKSVAYNIGDSRVYLFRKGKLHQLTIDDTNVAHMVKMGILSFEEAVDRKDKGVLSQHLGINPGEMRIQTHIHETIEIQNNDMFLLCSDGLTDMISDAEIALILNKKMSVESAVDFLISEAVKKGGKDNITVGIIKHIGKENKITGNIRRRIYGHKLRKKI